MVYKCRNTKGTDFKMYIISVFNKEITRHVAIGLLEL